MPQTPLILLDNVFDTIGLYPGAVLTASAQVVGREGFRVADYRRERTCWQTLDGSIVGQLKVDLGAGNARSVDYVFLDRGHNMAGRTLNIWFSDDGVTYTEATVVTVPASGSIGGDPTLTSMAATEEGACWAIFGATAAHRYWLVETGPGAAPSVVTGLMLGLRTQLLGYSTTFDEDAGGRTQATQDSTAGYRASDTTYAWRTVTLGLAQIGATEYDATIRGLRDLLFAKNQPAVVCMDYGTRPERAWMYQYEGTTWGMAKTRVLRSGTITLREVGQRL